MSVTQAPDPDHAEETKKKKKKKEEPPFFSFENFRSLGTLIVIILALRWSVAAPYHVPTASMEPTIKVGDRLLAWKLAYGLKIPFTNITVWEWTKVKRGDIIVFRYPKDTSIDYVKRVVGVAGDRIRVVDDVLYVNGSPQQRVNHDFDRSVLDDIDDNKDLKQLYRENLNGISHWTMDVIPSARHFAASSWPQDGYKTVPEGSVFVMGDNRHNSSDSRFWGKVPLDHIHGKALFVIWSMYTPAEKTLPQFRFYRFGEMLDAYDPPPSAEKASGSNK